jgi:hypothetical protein
VAVPWPIVDSDWVLIELVYAAISFVPAGLWASVLFSLFLRFGWPCLTVLTWVGCCRALFQQAELAAQITAALWGLSCARSELRLARLPVFLLRSLGRLVHEIRPYNLRLPKKEKKKLSYPLSRANPPALTGVHTQWVPLVVATSTG